MTRTLVNVATGRYVKGQARLETAMRAVGQHHIVPWGALGWRSDVPDSHGWPLPKDWPSHQDKPYAFKAYALEDASKYSDLLLWADASILPIRSLEPLWERIERDGYWFSANGWSNYEWTADSAYPDLFANEWEGWSDPEVFGPPAIDTARAANRRISHVVATAFGLNVRHPKGKAFLDEYYRLASETRAFCGPWVNSNHQDHNVTPNSIPLRVGPCGPPDVRGHRHDQTAASVIAWRLGMELTEPPVLFAYRGGETSDTILVADGSY